MTPKTSRHQSPMQTKQSFFDEVPDEKIKTEKVKSAKGKEPENELDPAQMAFMMNMFDDFIKRVASSHDHITEKLAKSMKVHERRMENLERAHREERDDRERLPQTPQTVHPTPDPWHGKSIPKDRSRR